MKVSLRMFFAGMALGAALTATAAEDDYLEFAEVGEYEHFYADAQATLVLPEGGRGERMRRLGGATVRFGGYISDAWALEGAAGLHENRGYGAAGVLWHWWLYEKFDPYLRLGAAVWAPGTAGPMAGWGCFWHFDDYWSLRADVDWTLGIDSGCTGVFAFSFGLQYSF